MEENKFATYKKMRADFYNKFKNNCVPIFEKFEAEKSKAINMVITSAVFVIILFFAVMWHFKMNMSDTWSITAPFVITYAGALLTIISCYSKKFESRIKKQIMPIVCDCFENLRWIEKPIVDHFIYTHSGLISKSYNKVTTDDVFEGTFRNVPLKIEENEYWEITRKRNSKGEYVEHTQVIFKGVIVTLQMNKNFTGHTLVKPDSLTKSVDVSGLRHTTLEDVKFEKQYDVFTNDEVEARYLLTPTFMERLTGVKNVFKAKKISCAFYQNNFILALDTRRDLFKLGSLFKKAGDTKQFFQMYEEIESILKLIDHFKLDQKIGL